MRREEFEHAIRAGGAVLGVHEVLVIGSQARHAGVAGDWLRERLAQVDSRDPRVRAAAAARVGT